MRMRSRRLSRRAKQQGWVACHNTVATSRSNSHFVCRPHRQHFSYRHAVQQSCAWMSAGTGPPHHAKQHAVFCAEHLLVLLSYRCDALTGSPLRRARHQKFVLTYASLAGQAVATYLLDLVEQKKSTSARRSVECTAATATRAIPQISAPRAVECRSRVE